MTAKRWLGAAVGGLLAGIVGVLAMVLVMVGARMWLGISPPPESLPDRFAPTLSIDTFFSLFGRFGGYNGLKKFGIQSGILGLAAVGSLVGVVYGIISQRARAKDAPGAARGMSRTGVVFVMVAAGVLWLASLVVLEPVLDANYRGLPPSRARVVTGLGLLAAYATYGLALIAAFRFLTGIRGGSETASVSSGALGRRAVVLGAVGAALAVPSYALLRRLYNMATFPYDGTTNSGPGVVPITPNDAFYTVTKNVIDPNISTGVWALEVDGLVGEPRRYGFDDLVALDAVEQESTLMCISNRIGSGLFSNAVWRGVPMRDLLNLSGGPQEGAIEVRLAAADGFVDTFSIEKAMDPTTMVVYQMNGEPLPERNGYPARVVVPGLYGEKNVKWVTRIEVVDHDAKGFYETQGWGPDFEIPTRSDMFSPLWRRGGGRDAFVEPFAVGQTATIKGRAFAGARDVSRVEYSTDDGESWRDARIDYPGTSLTWVFWSFDWEPTEVGTHVLLSRATDGTGAPQVAETVGTVPQGARGYHRVQAEVVAM